MCANVADATRCTWKSLFIIQRIRQLFISRASLKREERLASSHRQCNGLSRNNNWTLTLVRLITMLRLTHNAELAGQMLGTTVENVNRATTRIARSLRRRLAIHNGAT